MEEQEPDCALMDLVMPGLSGLETLRLAVRRFPATRIIILSMHAESAYVHEALAAGAAGYLLKGSDRAELELAVRAVARGQTYLTPAVWRTAIDALGTTGSARAASSRLDALTSRQLEVLRLVAEGNSTKQVAAHLGLSTKTVEAHRAALMQRLGIRDLATLVRFAVSAGVVSGDR